MIYAIRVEIKDKVSLNEIKTRIYIDEMRYRMYEWINKKVRCSKYQLFGSKAIVGKKMWKKRQCLW
jgi:hypothetical protein